MTKKRMAKAALPMTVRSASGRRIHIVKQWKADPKFADNVNEYLGDRSIGDPRVVAVHPLEGQGVVIIERDERRRHPGRKPTAATRKRTIQRRLTATLTKRRNGGG